MAVTYIPITTRLKASSAEGILVEAQQVAVSSTDKTNIKDYVDNSIKNAKVTGFTFKGSVKSIADLVIELNKGASVGDFWNISSQFSLSGDTNYNGTYPAGTTVAVRKEVAAGTTVRTDNVGQYIDPLGGVVADLSDSAKYVELSVSYLPTVSVEGAKTSPSTEVSMCVSDWARVARTFNSYKTSARVVLNVRGTGYYETVSKVEFAYTSNENFSLKFEANDKSYNIQYGLNGATTYKVVVGDSRLVALEKLLTLV